MILSVFLFKNWENDPSGNPPTPIGEFQLDFNFEFWSLPLMILPSSIPDGNCACDWIEIEGWDAGGILIFVLLSNKLTGSKVTWGERDKKAVNSGNYILPAHFARTQKR